MSNDERNKQKGTIAESAAATALLKEGFGVSFPLGDYLTWDLVTDWKGKVNRIQVKTGRKVKTTYHIGLTRSKDGSSEIYDSEACDFLMIILPYGEDYEELNGDGIYIVPVSECTVKSKHIWPPGMGGRKGVVCEWEKYRNQYRLLK